ncbi:MAG: HAD family phosphatase [Clostridia bacterium]|nr:HAD family phosphatase [Clostridia bacterium]
MEKTQKVYLFDFDGTLVDSMPTFVSVMLRILDEYGIKYGDDIVKIITPLGYQGTAEYYRGLGISLSTTELVELMNQYAQDEYAYKISAKETVVQTLKKLKERGDRLNVLTASPHSMLDPCLKRLGIWDLFDNVWSCDDFNTTKSDPKIYQSAAEKIGRRIQEIIFVDDNVNAVKTAKRAGMKAYGIYDASSAEYEDEMKAVSDRYIKNFSQLLTI